MDLTAAASQLPLERPVLHRGDERVNLYHQGGVRYDTSDAETI